MDAWLPTNSGSHNPEPEKSAPVVRIAKAPVSDGAVSRIVVPTATAYDAPRARSGSPIVDQGTRRICTSMPIPAPFPDIPAHVVQANLVGSLVATGLLRWVVVAPAWPLPLPNTA